MTWLVCGAAWCLDALGLSVAALALGSLAKPQKLVVNALGVCMQAHAQPTAALRAPDAALGLPGAALGLPAATVRLTAVALGLMAAAFVQQGTGREHDAGTPAVAAILSQPDCTKPK